MPARTDGSTRIESTKVFKSWDYAVFATLSLLGLGAIVNFLSFWFHLEEWRVRPITLAILTLLVLTHLAFNQFSWLMIWRMRRPVHRDPPPGLKVCVVTTFVPRLESLEMLEATVRALVAMDYPHDTWVLDEGDDPRVKKLCKELGVHHFSRRNRPEHQTEEGAFKARTKYGNLNSWLDAVGYARYDYLCAFDPDHVPVRQFLTRTLGYFQDPSIAYIQAPQVYYNQDASFISRGAAEETYSYYSSLQMASYSMGYPIITGCHNVHRMSALQEAGGFAPHDADDLLLTLYYLKDSWRGIYVPEVLAVGLTPVDWSSYLSQQLRWARSVLDIKFRILPRIAGRLPFKARMMSILHGLNYIEESFITPLSLLCLAYLLASGGAPVFSRLFAPAGQLLLLVTITQSFFRQRFFLSFRKEWGFLWRAGLLTYAKWPQIFQAFSQVILRSKVPYTITRKMGSNRPQISILWPHIVMASVLVGAWITGLLQGHRLDPAVYLCVTAILLVTAGLLATIWLHYPEPFDPRLLGRALRDSVTKADRVSDRRLNIAGETHTAISAHAAGGQTQVFSRGR